MRVRDHRLHGYKYVIVSDDLGTTIDTILIETLTDLSATEYCQRNPDSPAGQRYYRALDIAYGGTGHDVDGRH